MLHGHRHRHPAQAGHPGPDVGIESAQLARTAPPLRVGVPFADEPRGGVGGMASDVEIQAREILRMRERLNRIFAEATGQPIDKIKRDVDRDYWMQAEEAKAYGLVGAIVNSKNDIR